MRLIREPNLARVDEIYARWIALHEGRDAADSARVNARLVLALFNHLGDPEAILEAIELAGRD